MNPEPQTRHAWGVPAQKPVRIEAWLGDRWHTFDPRHNTRRIGMIPMAKGKDAGDCALTTVFSLHTLENFQVVTQEMGGACGTADGQKPGLKSGIGIPDGSWTSRSLRHGFSN